MNAALFGLASAVALGGADFMARFSARALGALVAYGAVLLVGAFGLTAWFLASGLPFVWSPEGIAWAIAHGVSVTMMCTLLYAGLARGPVGIVAPIVAAHPALVLIAQVAMGIDPTAIQWAAMVAIIAGGILIARSAEAHPQFAGGDGRELRTTLMVALGACLMYVVLVVTGQTAAPLVGELETACIGRWAGLAFMAAILAARRTAVAVPVAWLPFILAQGVLDSVGYVTFLAGLKSSAPHVSMVISSTFSVFTVLLARVFLKEPVNPMQWGAIGMIAAGTAVLAGGG